MSVTISPLLAGRIAIVTGALRASAIYAASELAGNSASRTSESIPWLR
jgi:hypothetical protein